MQFWKSHRKFSAKSLKKFNKSRRHANIFLSKRSSGRAECSLDKSANILMLNVWKIIAQDSENIMKLQFFSKSFFRKTFLNIYGLNFGLCEKLKRTFLHKITKINFFVRVSVVNFSKEEDISKANSSLVFCASESWQPEDVKTSMNDYRPWFQNSLLKKPTCWILCIKGANQNSVPEEDYSINI